MNNILEWLITKPHELGFVNINTHDLNWWLGQLFGMIGFCITGTGYFQKNEKRLKTLLTISGFFWMANFWFIAAYTPFFITLLNTVRQGISRVCHESTFNFRNKINNIFIVLNILACLLSWQGLISIFPTVASILAGFATLILTNKSMRLGFLSSEACWCVNNLYYHSIGGLCANAINFPLLIMHILKNDPITQLEKDIELK